MDYKERLMKNEVDSRLPKPNTLFKKSKTLVDININNTDQKMTKSRVALPKSTSNANLVDGTKKDNILKNDEKSNNENKPPPKVLTRAQTNSTFLKPNNPVKAVKRPGTVESSTVDKKKPKVKTGTLSTRRSMKFAAQTKTIINRPTQNKSTNANGKTTAGGTIISRWDYKGRYTQANSDLNKLRETHKEVLEKIAQLQTSAERFESDESKYKMQIEKYETVKAALTKELETIKEELTKTQDEKDDIVGRFKKSEEALKDVTEELKKFKSKYAEQQDKLQKQTSEIEQVKKDLEHAEKLVKDLTNNKEELQSLVHQMDKDRRILHNTIQEMKGNIRVFCRVRPRTIKEASKPQCFIRFVDECTIEVGKSDGSDNTSCSGKVRGARQEFSFDKVFPHTASQSDIFEELSLLVQSALEGYNVCVFAYGQTGSGKTYTMEGQPDPDLEGMIPRTVRHIFKEMKEFELLGWEYRIEASFLEIYNEHIVDLLDSQCDKIHEIRMRDNRGHDLYVSNLKVEEIHNAEELQQCLLTAQRNRAVAATSSNERSSRSHSVARIRLIGQHKTKEEICIGNLNLVDLAGSERLKNEEAARTTETKNINKSLANLGNVILALLKKQEHVPYRNSKLTHLLMPSLGGNSKTLMLLNISPLDECYNETLNSLRFASNVNSCKVNVKRVKTALPMTNMTLSSSSITEN